MAQLQSVTLAAGGTVKLPRGTTAERPASPTSGMVRYNTTTSITEIYNGTAWVSFTIPKVGRNNANIITSSGAHAVALQDGFKIHTFFSGSHTFTPTASGYVEVMVLAGGGGGGWAGPGGGGAGGLIYNNAFFVQADAPLTVTVGAGGANSNSNNSYRGFNGGNSVFGSLTAVGGGGGAGGDGTGVSGTLPAAGGSGGGAS